MVGLFGCKGSGTHTSVEEKNIPDTETSPLEKSCEREPRSLVAYSPGGGTQHPARVYAPSQKTLSLDARRNRNSLLSILLRIRNRRFPVDSLSGMAHNSRF